MSLTPTAEDYLQAIDALAVEGEAVIAARLAGRMRVSAAAVSQTIERMTRDGLVTVGEDRRIELTAPGRAAADSVVRRHRLTERFLTDVLRLDWTQAHEEAHRLEHGISELVEGRLSAFLHHPATCPHGGPIPGNFPAGADRDWRPLASLHKGDRATIVRVSEAVEEDASLLGYCDAKNLRPGVPIVVAETGPDGLLMLDVEGAVAVVSGPLSSHILCQPAAR